MSKDDLAAVARHVAVIIVNYNSGAYLLRCIQALSRQSPAPGLVVIVDNHSTDDSLSKLKVDYTGAQCDEAAKDGLRQETTLAATSLPTRAPTMDGALTKRWGMRIVVLEQQRNTGFACANNLAAAYVRGLAAQEECYRWLALLNPDAFVHRDWLAELLLAAQRNEDYTMFASRLLQYPQGTLLDGAGDCYHTSGLGWRRGHGQRAEGNYAQDEEVFAPCAAAAMYSADVFERVGGFDEDYFCYFEDLDLGFRLRLHGQRCLYVAAAAVDHVGSATTGKQSDFSVYHGHRNLVWTYVKNMPGVWLWLYLPYHVLINLAGLLYYSRRGQYGVIFRAKRDALRGIKRAWSKRRCIQNNRQHHHWRHAALRTPMSRGLRTLIQRR